jgi:hypothetical protein
MPRVVHLRSNTHAMAMIPVQNDVAPRRSIESDAPPFDPSVWLDDATFVTRLAVDRPAKKRDAAATTASSSTGGVSHAIPVRKVKNNFLVQAVLDGVSWLFREPPAPVGRTATQAQQLETEAEVRQLLNAAIETGDERTAKECAAELTKRFKPAAQQQHQQQAAAVPATPSRAAFSWKN